jgi:hypothetical protein
MLWGCQNKSLAVEGPVHSKEELAASGWGVHSPAQPPRVRKEQPPARRSAGKRQQGGGGGAPTPKTTGGAGGGALRGCAGGRGFGPALLGYPVKPPRVLTG